MLRNRAMVKLLRCCSIMEQPRTHLISKITRLFGWRSIALQSQPDLVLAETLILPLQ